MSKPISTIKDIAFELGISPSTVSRALKDHPDISRETKKIVMETAQKLHYQPNILAMNLRKKSSNVIGIIVPQIVHHFFSSVISGIDEVVYEAGFNLLISQSNESMQREIHNTRTLIASRAAGVLVSKTKDTNDCSHFQELIDRGLSVVFFDRAPEQIDTDKVIIDDKNAASSATSYLIRSGCRRIVHLKGPQNLLIGKKRLAGYISALKKYGLAIDKNLILESDSYEKGKVTIENLINNQVVFDAVFAVNDMTALGALAAIKEHQLKVPDDVSVIGFTNGIVSTISEPPLSTIEQNGYLMGMRAAELLINRIKGVKNNNSITEYIPTQLILRGTTL